MFAWAPFMHWLVCLKHKYGWGIWRSLPTHFPLTGLAHIDLDCQCVEISRALILGNPCTVFYLLWPYMMLRWHKYIHRTFSQPWSIFVEGLICGLHREKQGLFASNHSQMFTVSWSLPPTCLLPYLFFPPLFCHVSWLISLPFFGPAVPRVVAVSPQMRLVEDNPSSLSLVEIYKQRCAKKGIEHDNPISRYYDRLATVQARGTQASHQV